ncbi:homeobox protein NOBOX-like [Planoprotostelium fungivorum]|uniref:Homeobox protein NOBOX-like n=1 Tax=Planoprotostelium fungivorum TaxID=1890364 RepID=A0A2P6MNW2_9EUKA|nr:homeobox protein NOBOX-like [Planoprotostelium fungivorum]
MDIERLLSPPTTQTTLYRTSNRNVFFFKPPANCKTDCRRVFDEEQQSQLLLEYEKDAYPSLDRRTRIAENINTTPRRVNVWFQNRRQRKEEKRDKLFLF